MKNIRFFLCVFCLFTTLLNAQYDSLRVQRINSYKDWGWESVVFENRFITAAFVPSMGGSMMQYDFGIDTFLILNPSTFGIDFNPYLSESPFNGSWGFGGCQIWSTPEGWPPPAVLTWGTYLDSILFSYSDSASIRLNSELEITPFEDIGFEKQITVYKHSTGIKIINTIRNMQSSPVDMGLMIAAEVVTQHQNNADYENFSVYFPLNINSIFGSSGVQISPNSPAFQGEISPGVFAVEYAPHTGKVYADSPSGWIAYVDERDTQTYVIIFDVFTDLNYPDPGANTEVYIEGSIPFMAMEILSPLEHISSDSGLYTFTHYFYSTRLDSPVLKANHAGAVSSRLEYDSLTHTINGRFGFFHKGEAQLLYLDSLNNELGQGPGFKVTPDTILAINIEVELPIYTTRIELITSDYYGNKVGVIDYIDYNEIAFLSNEIKVQPSVYFYLLSNPVTNGQLHYCTYLNEPLECSINIFSLNGDLMTSLSSRLESGMQDHQTDISMLSEGIYIISMQYSYGQINRRLVIL